MKLTKTKIILTLVFVVLISSITGSADPGVQITFVPDYGSDGSLYGNVTGVPNPQEYRVATYIQVEGSGWWSKPFAAQPTVPVNPEGSFSLDVTTGGLDRFATIYSVGLLEAAQEDQAEVVLGSNCLPRSPFFVADDSWERYGPTVSFAGRAWAVKEAPLPVGPGPNRFSPDSDKVWIDATGKLHLTVQQQNSNWYSTEVFLTESLGYGSYLFQTSSRVDQLDSNAVFGAFTWDGYGDGNLPEGTQNREIDFEDSRWGEPNNLHDSQFVIQPWDTPGNLHGFKLPDLAEDPNLTRILNWGPDSIEFLLIRGPHSFTDYSPSDIIEHWTYLHDPDADHPVPQAGHERFRFNLWLVWGNAPVGDGVLEVVVDDFDFVADILPGDVNGDGFVGGEDLTVILTNWGRSDMSREGGDLNSDGFVGGEDYTEVLTYWGHGVPPDGVPEPASLVSVLMSWIVLTLRLKR